MDAYGHYLSRLAYALVKDREKAKDIVQDVFICYYLQLDQFEGRSSVKTYLYRITVNECRNYFKSWAYRKVEVSKIKNTFLIHKETPEEAYLKQESKNLKELPIFNNIKERLVMPRFTDDGSLIVNGEAADFSMYLQDVE